MHQVKVPIVPVPDRTKFEDFLSYSEQMWERFCKETGQVSPIMIFEPCDAPRFPTELPAASEAPEELIICAVGREARQMIRAALDEIEKREPHLPKNHLFNFKLKPNTPLKAIFREMAASPLTVFSFAFAEDGPDSGIMFFIRTGFTVNELRRAFTQPS